MNSSNLLDSQHSEKPEFPYLDKKTKNWKPAGYEHKVYRNILHTIGNTPLVQLNRIPKDYGLECEIYAKCEYLNPGGSIKDRVAYSMMVEAENAGLAKNGTRFVEPTSGNTGIGMALATAVQGYGCTIVTPDKNSDEKLDTIRLLGADVIQTPSVVSHEDPRSFVSIARRERENDPLAITADQYSNTCNPITHYEYTATEILLALDTIDMVVLGIGTGGTLSGIAHKIKEHHPKCIVVAVDPKGSIIFGHGEFQLFMVEGIGGDFVPLVLDKAVVDRVESPTDSQSFNMAREVIRKEGLLCGGSSGCAMYATIQACKALNMGAGHRVVVIFADGIRNYMTKFVSDQWMEAHLFKEPPERKGLTWWNDLIWNVKVDRTAPRVLADESCSDALGAMGTDYNVAIVIDQDGFYVGAVSKDSLRNNATNPKKEEKLNLKDPVSLHLIKNCYKIVENVGNPTVGLVSRILDITPFVIVVDKDHEKFIPKGIVTADVVLDYIVKQDISYES